MGPRMHARMQEAELQPISENFKEQSLRVASFYAISWRQLSRQCSALLRSARARKREVGSRSVGCDVYVSLLGERRNVTERMCASAHAMRTRTAKHAINLREK